MRQRKEEYSYQTIQRTLGTGYLFIQTIFKMEVIRELDVTLFFGSYSRLFSP